MTPSEPYLEEIHTWRQEMDQKLRRRDGWLALAGLHWLSDGRHSVGSGEDADIALGPGAPPRLGTFTMGHGRVYFEPTAGVPVDGAPPEGDPLRPDTSGDPHRLQAGEVTIMVIERGPRLGLRMWDNARPERTGFPGRAWFPIDPAARVLGRFHPEASSARILVPNQLGDLNEEPLLGTAVFRWKESEASLVAVPADDDALWFLFADRTNGTETYPAGRFLIAAAPAGGEVVLDFNRAYNPPCAFTSYATCPLPPEPNHLPFAIEAGERLGPTHASQASDHG